MTPEPFEPADDDAAIARQLRDVPPGALAAAPDAAFRDALRRRSSVIVRRRPLLRRLGAAAALLLVYGAGIATARFSWVAQGPRSGEPAPPAAATEIAVESAVPEPRIEYEDPREIEQRALASPRERRVELLKLAGDRYLGEEQEVDAALRCYRGALSLMRREERGDISSQETWLFSALKVSRS